MEIFHTNVIDTIGQTASLPKAEAQHCFRVMRKKVGDRILLINGADGVFYKAEIEVADIKACALRIVDQQQDDGLPPVELAVCPTKSNTRFEWLVEKATEIGLSSIQPILSFNSERKVLKKERFEKIILAACKQSKRAYLPILPDVTKFKEYVIHCKSEHKFIAYCGAEFDKISLGAHPSPTGFSSLLIGPEGGFSKEEVALAVEHGFKPISLGQKRLRTETAAIYGLSALHLMREKTT